MRTEIARETVSLNDVVSINSAVLKATRIAKARHENRPGLRGSAGLIRSAHGMTTVEIILSEPTDVGRELARAARALLEKVEAMTTDDFAHGAEKEQRLALEHALRAYDEEANV